MHVYEQFQNLTPAQMLIEWPGGGGKTERGNVLRHRRFRQGERRKKPSGLDPSPYVLRDVQQFSPRGVGTVTALGYPEGTRYTGTHIGFSFAQIISENGLLAEGVDENLMDQAAVKAFAKLNARDLDLGTAWLERGKTADLIRGVAETGVRALRCIKRKDGRGLLNELALDHDGARGRGVVDAYLAYHYGMKPLLQDVAGATSALARRTNAEDWRIRVSALARVDQNWKSKRLVMAGLGYAIVQEAFKGSRVTITAQQRVVDRHQDLMWATGLDNPLGTAWEVTPFSFVADWMVPIGDWLEALNSLKYYKDFVQVRSQKFWSSIRANPAKFVQGGALFDCAFKGSQRILTLDRRVVAGGIPIVGLPMKNPASLDHMAKALALLASRSANSAELPRFIRY